MALTLGWLTVEPDHGSGNETIKHTAAPHTGRVERSKTVTITGTGVAEPVRYAVTQLPKEEFIALADLTVNAAAADGTVQVSGTANTSRISVSAGSPLLTVQPTYTAAGASAAMGAEIPGDPGAAAQYEFAFTVAVAENTGTEARDLQLTVSDAAGGEQTVTVHQLGSAPSITVTPQSVTIPQDGSETGASVTANVAWTISGQ